MARALRKTSWEYLEVIFQDEDNGEDQSQNKNVKIIENIFEKFSQDFSDEKIIKNMMNFNISQHFRKISRICIEIPIEKIQIPENVEKIFPKMFSIILKFLF